MKSTIGVYPDHEAAIAAVNALKAAGFPQKHLSIIGHAGTPEQARAEGINADGTESDEAFDKPERVAATTVGVTVVAGAILGALTGVGLLAVPGLGFLVGAGALGGVIAGMDVGLVSGGIISALELAGVSKHHEALYHEHLKEGRYLVIAQGNPEEVNRAHEVLLQHDEHLHLEAHV